MVDRGADEFEAVVEGRKLSARKFSAERASEYAEPNSRCRGLLAAIAPVAGITVSLNFAVSDSTASTTANASSGLASIRFGLGCWRYIAVMTAHAATAPTAHNGARECAAAGCTLAFSSRTA